MYKDPVTALIFVFVRGLALEDREGFSPTTFSLSADAADCPAFFFTYERAEDWSR